MIVVEFDIDGLIQSTYLQGLQQSNCQKEEKKDKATVISGPISLICKLSC